MRLSFSFICRFFCVFLLPFLGACALFSSYSSNSGPATPLTLTVLHTNDTHSHITGLDKWGGASMLAESPVGGTARLSAAIKEARTRLAGGTSGENSGKAFGGASGVLALDAGDMFEGALFYSVSGWPMLANMANHTAYDAMTLGNHEFDAGCEALAGFVSALKFPVLAANLVPGKSCPLYGAANIHPFVIREVDGVSVGIIGLANPDVHEKSSPCEDTHFEDSVKSVQKQINILGKRGVRHIILLSHVGLDEDLRLAGMLDGVDVIVGGHSHSLLANPDADGNVPKGTDGPYPVVESSASGSPVLVVSAGCDTEYLGELTVHFDEQGIIRDFSGNTRRMDDSVIPDPEVLEDVRRYVDGVNDYRTLVVAEHNIVYPDGKELCREGECLGGMLIADSMLDYGRQYGADAAFVNGGCVRSALSPGTITQGDILTVLPFGNLIVINEYSGETLLAMLEHGVSGENGLGVRLLHPAGVRYAYNAALPVGQRITEAFIQTSPDRFIPIDPSRQYRIALPSFLAQGGDGFLMLKNAPAISSPTPLDVDVFSTYLKKNTPIPMPPDGRIIPQKP